MKESRRLRVGLVAGLTLAILAAAAVLAVGGQSASQEKGAHAKPRGGLGEAANTHAPLTGHSNDDWGGSFQDSERPEGRPDESSSAQAPRAARPKVAALERAAGLDPRRLKFIPWIPNRVRVKRGEALPCTGAEKPINFEIFSAGPEVDGIPLTQVSRRCDESALADELPANFVSYIYGTCEIPEGQSGCAPPLEIQSFPACQRSYADYSFEGKPLPYRELPRIDGAQVVKIAFQFDQRIEVYTGSTTIVVYAANPAVAEAALESLRSQLAGAVPAARPQELAEEHPGGLVPPTPGATEGELPCRSSV